MQMDSSPANGGAMPAEGSNLPAIVLQFPQGSLIRQARLARRRWFIQSEPMLRVASELLEENEATLRGKVQAIVNDGVEGLLVETDNALSETASDLLLMALSIRTARRRLRQAARACAIANPAA